MLLLLNCISNCSSRMALKTWNMFRKFDKFCLFSPVREKWILKRKIRIWLLLQMFPGWRKMFGGGEVYFMASWQLPVCLFYFFLELNEDLLDDFIGVPKSSSHSIAIFLNYSLFLTAHFQPIYSVFTHYVFHVLMELPCHCICINVVSDNISWLVSYYSSK